MNILRTASYLSLALVALSAGTVSAQDRERWDPPALALGDSVVFGYVTQAGHEYVNPANFIGSPEYLANLLHVDMANAACPGETTGSFLSASAPDNGCRQFRATFPLHVAYGTTQAAFATRFLTQHPNARLVIVGVGANDVLVLENSCATDANPTQCIQAGLPSVLAEVGSNVAAILGELRASGFHGVTVVVNYYSPDYSDPTDTAITAALNQAIAAAAKAYGVPVADVFSAFQKVAANSLFGGNTCNAGLLNADPQNPALCDVHPTQSGQLLIAKTIAGVYSSAIW